MSIYDEGILIKSDVAAINFQGVCVTSSESISANTVNVNIGSQWLISSHSLNFTQNIFLSSSDYYVGNNRGGWDSSDYDTILSPSSDIKIEQGFIGIPSPFDIIIGDTITVCGMAYCDIPYSDTPIVDFVRLGVSLSAFNCSNLQATSPPPPLRPSYYFPQTGLTSDIYAYTPDDQYYLGRARVCFELNYTAEYDFPKCDTLFVLGFNTSNLLADSSGPIQVTYTFNVNRNC